MDFSSDGYPQNYYIGVAIAPLFLELSSEPEVN